MLVLWGIAMEKIRTSVKIAGKEYALTSYDSAQYVQRLGVLVDRRLCLLETDVADAEIGLALGKVDKLLGRGVVGFRT